MGYKAAYGLQWRRAVEKRRSGMRFEEAERGSGARAGLVWRSAAGKKAFRLISQDLKEVRQV